MDIAANSATTALPESWTQVEEWAEEHSVLEEFFVVANATGLIGHPHHLRRVLVELCSSLAKKTLEAWRDETQYGNVLHKLSAANPPSDHRVAGLYLTNNLIPVNLNIPSEIDTYYLLALLVTRLPVVEQEEEREWFERLRLWLFVHAVERTALGTRQDENLEIACSKLRLAHDGHKRWLSLFERFRTELIDFESIGIHITVCARQILNANNSAQSDLKPVERKLLESLIAVASHIHTPKKNGAHLPSVPGVYRPAPEPWIWEAVTKPATDELPTENQDLPKPILIPSDDDGDDLLQIEVDEKASYAHQQLQARTIILASAEDLHFLPWSWGRPNPIELPRLTAWLQRSLASTDKATQALATFISIALVTGRSLRRALDIPIGTEAGQEWTIICHKKQLERRPPRRIPGWAPKNPEATDWITPTGTSIQIKLPELAACFLLDKLTYAPNSKFLGNLWDKAWGESPESAFHEKMRDVLPRLTPGMLGNTLPQHVFLKTGDSTLARLVSCHYRTGLPGATAYPSWRQDEVNSIFQDFLRALGFDTSDAAAASGETLNTLGSQLNVLESLLIEAIQNLNKKVETLRQGQSLIDFHNGLTAKLLIKLYAATGARPAKDPFSSPRHFCHADGTLFVDDKHSSKARAGRLVLLPMALMKEIEQDYLTHLDTLADSLKASTPDLARAISTLAKGKESNQLPFFFLLETGDGKKINWRSASEKHLKELALFDCPLPLNLFRHRLATQLRKRSVDPELIDAQLGHSEFGAATHGDYSFRVWHEDMTSLKPEIEYSLHALGFCPTGAWSHPKQPLDLLWEGSQERIFGAKARAKERNDKRRRAIKEAKSIILAHCKGKTLDALTPAEHDSLALTLLRNEAGLPHPFGALRFSVFLNQARKLTKKIRIRRHYQQLKEESSPFSTDAPGATIVLQELQSRVKKLDANLTQHRLGKTDASMIAAVLLIVQSRIADNKLITDVLSGKNIRLIHAPAGFFLEHGKNLVKNDPAAPVQRHRITNQAARLINMSMKRSHQRSIDDLPPPEILSDIAQVLICDDRLNPRSTVRQLVHSLTRIINQANVQSLPGVVAALLGGRIESSSLEWRDWYRLRWNQRITIEHENILLPQEATDEPPPPGRKPEVEDLELLQNEAKALFSEIEKLIDPDPDSKPLEPKSRREIKAEIRRTLARAEGRAPSSCLLLGAWAESLLERKTRKGEFLARNTIKRYLVALSPAFVELGYLFDPELADEDQVTEFYSYVISGRRLSDSQYVFQRLKEFHHWLSRLVEVEDPIWAELPTDDGSVALDPGIIVESDYLKAFNLLARQATSDTECRYAALLILGAYRFGLRSGEMLGLLRSDWINIGNSVVLVIENNRYRRLKRKSSRRVIPLVTPLSTSETKLVDWALAMSEASARDVQRAPLFPSTNKRLQQRIRRLSLNALKSATGNPASNLHRLRHTAANQVMLGLAGITLSSWHRVGAVGTSEFIHIQELLLGRTGQTRRASWASSRHLGHAGPDTTFKSYHHFISDLAEQLINLPTEPHRQFEHAIYLTKLPVVKLSKPTLTPPEPIFLYGQAETTIKSLRLLSRGKTVQEIADWMGWQPEHLEHLVDGIRTINSKMWGLETNCQERDGRSLVWLNKISNDAWSRILTQARKVDEKLSTIQDQISLDSAVRMIGSKRQILAWRPEHFRALVALLDLWDISKEQYVLLMAGNNQQIRDLAVEHGFLPGDPKELGPRGGKQIDCAFNDDQQLYRVTARCSLCLKESHAKVIRNRYELMVAFLAISNLAPT